jgi:hypothetical protein
MGHYNDERGIRCFTPDNTPDTLYLAANFRDYTLDGIIEKAQEHFGGSIDLSSLTIKGEHVHTSCLGYDRYDASDYTDYLVIERK